jgi:hypothetical protein
VDAAVPLARRARHDGHAGVQQVLAGELQVGVAAAEDARKELLQALVDPIEGLLEARPGLAVDLADGRLQRLQ